MPEMHQIPQIDFLKDLVVVLGAAILVVAVLRRAGIPAIAGFILAGVLSGPKALQLVADTYQVEVLAEVGVILLLFGIGLELSLERIRRFWKAVVVGGGIQVAVSIAATALIGKWWGLELGAALFLGCVIAVSSTAVVLRGLSARGELDSPHGLLAVGILVFQDLCVIPMILVVPFLAGRGGSIDEFVKTAGTAALILVGVLVAARLLVPRLLGFVAGTRQRDLFVLTVFLVCFGTAWTVSLAGISLALGTFLAGLVVAGSEFRHQALSDLIPAREVFASLFFVSVGMLLDVTDVLEHLMSTVGLLALIVTGKFLVIFLTALLLRLPVRVSILSAAALCQVGEFSFVLLNAASGTGLLGATLSHNLLVAIILSMLLTPLAIVFGPHLASRVSAVSWLKRRRGTASEVDEEEPHSRHVIIAGYGLAGQSVCRALRESGIPYIVLELNPNNLRTARNSGDRAVLGDVTQSEVLEELNCRSARLVVVSINDTRATSLAVRKIREIAPHVPVIVRTQYEIDLEVLKAAGATRVIAAEVTASDEIVRASLVSLGAPHEAGHSGLG